jgi:hypothetical protein
MKSGERLSFRLNDEFGVEPASYNPDKAKPLP